MNAHIQPIEERLTRENANKFLNHIVEFTFNKQKIRRRILGVTASGVKIDFPEVGNNIIFPRKSMVIY
jgi:hypothetical protein